MVRAVVFDFDGVIANSEPLHYRAYRDVLAERSVALTEADYYARYLGFDDRGAFNAIAADQGLKWNGATIAELVARKAERLEALERDLSVLFPGAAAAIHRIAAACPLAIASGALRTEIVRVLERENLSEFFPVIVAAEDAPSKPAPDPYLRAVDRMSALNGAAFAHADCIAIEDSNWGLQSARTAGLRTIAIAHTYPASALEGQADAVIEHLDLLTCELLSKVVRRSRPETHS
jgi:HAD superfamily hydrolase (TIGR01509 family)